MIDIQQVVNTEQLLQFALGFHSIAEELLIDSPDSTLLKNNMEVSERIITWYCVNEFLKREKSFTEEDICERFSELKVQFFLENLVHQGLIEPDLMKGDGETSYYLTELGKQLMNNLCDNEEKEIS